MSKRGGGGNPISLFSFQDIITSVTGIMILVTLLMTLELVQRSFNSPAVKTQEIVEEVKPAAAEVLQRIEELKRRLEQQAAVAAAAAGLDATTVRTRLQDARRAAAALVGDVERLTSEEHDAERRRKDAEREQTHTADQDRERRRLEEEAKRLQEELDKLKSSNRIVFNRDPGSSKTPWLVDLSGSAITIAQVGVSAPPTVFRGASAAESIGKFVAWSRGRDPNAEYFVLLIRPSSVDTFHMLREQLVGFDFGFDVLKEDQTVIDPQSGASAP